MKSFVCARLDIYKPPHNNPSTFTNELVPMMNCLEGSWIFERWGHVRGYKVDVSMPPREGVALSFGEHYFSLFFSQIIHPYNNLSSIPPLSLPPPPPLPDPLFLHFFSERRLALRVMTEYGVTKCYKTGHYPSYQSWMRQSSKRKRVP